MTKIQDPIINNTGGAVCNTAMVLASWTRSFPSRHWGKSARMRADWIWEAFIIIPISMFPRWAQRATPLLPWSLWTAAVNSGPFRLLGANEVFCQDDINWDKFDAKIFHIGYLLSLNALDEPDDQYGTKMARLLACAREHGLETSVDVVSEMSDRFTKIVPPALKYTDYCIINEIEAQCTTGISLPTTARRMA